MHADNFGHALDPTLAGMHVCTSEVLEICINQVLLAYKRDHAVRNLYVLILSKMAMDPAIVESGLAVQNGAQGQGWVYGRRRGIVVVGGEKTRALLIE